MIYTIAHVAMFLGMCRGMNPRYFNRNFGGWDQAAREQARFEQEALSYPGIPPGIPAYWDKELYGVHPNNPRFKDEIELHNVQGDPYFRSQNLKTKRYLYDDHFGPARTEAIYREANQQASEIPTQDRNAFGQQQAASEQAQGPNVYTGNEHQQTTKNTPVEETGDPDGNKCDDTSSNIRATLSHLDATARLMKETKKVQAEKSPIEQQREAENRRKEEILKKRTQERLAEYQSSKQEGMMKDQAEHACYNKFRKMVKDYYQQQNTWWKDITIQRQLLSAEDLVKEINFCLGAWKNLNAIFWDENSEKQFEKNNAAWGKKRNLKKYLMQTLKIVSEDTADKKTKAKGLPVQDITKFKAHHRAAQAIINDLRTVYSDLLEESEIWRRQRYLQTECQIFRGNDNKMYYRIPGATYEYHPALYWKN